MRAPLLISSMTGGSPGAQLVNRHLAAAAQSNGVALALGSMRAALEDDRLTDTFAVRDLAPDVLLLANVGAVGLQIGSVKAMCARLEVDALVLHLNPLQEAIQPEGQPSFARALDSVHRAVAEMGLPVIVKEVGFGMAPEDIEALMDAGVQGIDVAGAGGTNWALVEGVRDRRAGAVASAFADWGWPTAETLQHAVAKRDAGRRDVVVIGSGGIRDGVEAAKVLCLGADLVGIGRGLLAAATTSEQAASDAMNVIVHQLRIAAFATGARTRADLGLNRLDPSPPAHR